MERPITVIPNHAKSAADALASGASVRPSVPDHVKAAMLTLVPTTTTTSVAQPVAVVPAPVVPVQSLSNLEQLIASEAAHHNFIKQDSTTLARNIQATKALQGLSEHELRTAIGNAFETVNRSNKREGATVLSVAKRVQVRDVIAEAGRVKEEGAKVIQHDPKRITALHEQIKKSTAEEKMRGATRSHANSVRENPHANLMARIESETKTMEKATAGMGLIMAALFAIGGFANLQQAKKKDESGQERIQPMQLCVGFIMFALAFGTTIVSHRSWQSATAR